jgi:ABC-type lipoprotein release transport system permease subunit
MPGDTVTLTYRVWEDPGFLKTASATFQVAGIVPIAGAAADRDLVPDFPGVTGSATLRDWDPPFPIDLRRVRPVDEDYWRRYRTTPKAFIPLQTGQSLWQSRHGALTSIRVEPPPSAPLAAARSQFAGRLLARLDPLAIGFSVHDVRADGLAASRGATDFGEYFTYFSFFLVASAVLLAVLFFKLGVEQRGREVGLLRAVGFTPGAVRRLFILEALALSIGGSLVGMLGAAGYGYLMMAGLRTWWVDAVGTTALDLHVSAASLIVGAIAGVLASVVSIWWTLRSLKAVSERSLLAGRVTKDDPVAPDLQTLVAPTQAVPAGEAFDTVRPKGSGRRASGRRAESLAAIGLLAIGLLLIGGGFVGWIGRTGAFFGAGTALLGSCLSGIAVLLRRPREAVYRRREWPLVRLGFRNAAYRPGRSVLSVAVMASATFLLISVGAFRKDDGEAPTDPRSGTGGYALIVNTMLPIVHDPNSPEGKDLIGLDLHPDVTVVPFRVRPGDDASCLNLYEPRQPRIIAAPPAFIAAGRFSFQSSLASSAEERANPWRLLERPLEENVIPVVADANSMTYVLHKSIGEDIVFTQGRAPVRLRLVAALADSVFQSELVMSDANFRMLFPDLPGFQLLLVDPGRQPVADLSSTIEDRLSDFGADAVPSGERLAEFHRVENTYLATFQTLGGLGLLLGTIGLAAVLLRNVLERRRELALLGAVGFRRADIFTIVIAENTLLLVAGLISGTTCALVAIAPAAIERGGRLPVDAGAWLLLFGVLTAGLLSSFIATRVTLRTRLLGALKAE